MTFASSRRSRQFWQRRQMQIREQDQAGRGMRIFGWLRLLHLDHQIGAPQTSAAVGRISAPASMYSRSGMRAADPGLGFHQHAMAGFAQAPSRRWAPGRRVFRDL